MKDKSDYASSQVLFIWNLLVVVVSLEILTWIVIDLLIVFYGLVIEIGSEIAMVAFDDAKVIVFCSGEENV